MTATELNPARKVELERLIAEQASEDTNFAEQGGRLSLDATKDGEPWLEVFQESDAVESGPALSQEARVKEWRDLRKQGWTYQRIAEYAGVSDQTVRYHISRGDNTRVDSKRWRLEHHLEEARHAYEAGAFLREIAELLYEETGFASWQSCYQQLRRLFLRHGIAIRSRDEAKRNRSGRPEPGAPMKEWQRFWRKQNQAAKAKRNSKRVRCDALVGKRHCRRLAQPGEQFCEHHDPTRESKVIWTEEAMIAALRKWTEANGRLPLARDWDPATDAHPCAALVIRRFGGWHVALYEAGLSEQKRRHVTHCRNGHPYSNENTYVDSQGWRHCRTCKRNQSRRWWTANH